MYVLIGGGRLAEQARLFTPAPHALSSDTEGSTGRTTTKPRRRGLSPLARLGEDRTGHAPRRLNTESQDWDTSISSRVHQGRFRSPRQSRRTRCRPLPASTQAALGDAEDHRRGQATATPYRPQTQRQAVEEMAITRTLGRRPASAGEARRRSRVSGDCAVGRNHSWGHEPTPPPSVSTPQHRGSH